MSPSCKPVTTEWHPKLCKMTKCVHFGPVPLSHPATQLLKPCGGAHRGTSRLPRAGLPNGPGLASHGTRAGSSQRCHRNLHAAASASPRHTRQPCGFLDIFEKFHSPNTVPKAFKGQRSPVWHTVQHLETTRKHNPPRGMAQGLPQHAASLRATLLPVPPKKRLKMGPK